MRAVIQRVTRARVLVGQEISGQIGPGLLALLGIARTDGPEQARYLAEKIIHLRIFDDETGRMNRSLLDTGGEFLVVSQFTLYGDTRKGRRPSYDEAAPPEVARNLYNYFVEYASTMLPSKVATGIFQAEMMVELVNDGPVTLLCESKL